MYFCEPIIRANRLKISPKMYNWQHKDWAGFSYKSLNIDELNDKVKNFSDEVQRILTDADGIKNEEGMVRFLIDEAQKTSEIEGEYISREDLMSSVKNKLGISPNPAEVKDKRANAIAAMLLDVRHSYKRKLTEATLKNWHKLLLGDSKTVRAGKYRKADFPMQVVSGIPGRETVHFEAPPSEQVPQEMKQFVAWYNQFETPTPAQALIKTAVTHLYFESIHPFEDGNGRIGRALAEKCLAQSFGKPVFFGISGIIEKNKKLYYNSLKTAQRTLEISEWIAYFIDVILEAKSKAVKMVRFSLQKTVFFDIYGDVLNQRQLKAINKMFDAGYMGFEGGMTTKKYIGITHASKATSTRDLQHLSEIGALRSFGKGRNVHYFLNCD